MNYAGIAALGQSQRNLLARIGLAGNHDLYFQPRTARSSATAPTANYLRGILSRRWRVFCKGRDAPSKLESF
jgi:hypothetical protein